MKCDELIHTLSLGGEHTPAQRAHVRACPACRALLAHDRAFTSARRASAPPRIKGELAQLLTQDPGKTRSAGSVARVAYVLLASVLALVIVLSFLARPDLPFLGEHILFPAVVWLAVGVAGLAMLFFRGQSGLGAPAWMRSGYVVSSVAAFVALTFYTVSTGVRHATSMASEPATPHDCLVVGLGVVLFVGAIALHLGKHMTLVGARMAGAVVGCATGAIAELLLHLHCASVQALHLGVVHGLLLLIAMMLGAWAGPRQLAA